MQQQALPRPARLTQPTPLQLPRGRAPLAVLARRTVGGGGKRDAKGPAPARPPPPSKSKASNAAAPLTTRPSKGARPSSSNGRGRAGQQGQPGASRLEEFMRTTPGFNRFLDGTLILGDAVMVLATEASSERLPLEQIPPLAAVAAGSWVLAGALLGDYTKEPDPDANPLSDALGWPVFAAVVSAMITWAVSIVLAIFGFSWLVTSYVVDPEVVLEVARDGMLSPQLEVSVSLLITMSCWRGIAAWLRL